MDSCSGVSDAIQHAVDYLLSIQRPGEYFWCAECEADVTMTSEYVMLYQILGLQLEDSKVQKLIKYFKESQNPADGSWSLAYGIDGDVSATTEAYLALTILGVDAEDPVLRKAKSFIRSKGGLGLVHVQNFTRMNLALFGLLPWEAVPLLPAELILLPSIIPFNLYNFPAWSRPIIVPLLVINNHRPVYRLPNEKCYTMMDELWLAGTNRYVPYVPPLRQALLKHGASWKSFFCVMEHVLRGYEKIRIQGCPSPVWDTSLATIALLDCGYNPREREIEGAIRWMLDRQCLVEYGDWQVHRPSLESGGWSFEYFNTWYPDVDDSAAVLVSLFKHDPKSIHSSNVQRGLKWVIGMQNTDGGWGAFEAETNKRLLDEIPFSDANSLCDPSFADLAGHILEMLGIYLQISEKYDHNGSHQCLRAEVRSCISRAVKYLRDSQELQGSWYGRWGVNYINGTSGSLCGLGSIGFPKSDLMVSRAIEWLKDCQNDDGGWGESVVTYRDKSMMGKGIGSIPSQTAWAVMGLLAYLPPEDQSIKRGVMWLLHNLGPSTKSCEGYEGGYKIPVSSRTGMTWTENHFTGTGYPNHLFIKYHLYSHYFPMMALGRYSQSLSAARKTKVEHPYRI
ncbi:hypothetical protein R1sor_004491 [Riccia sorocarpa]|uniref:Terpene cyclase/mutase family member n=1 Tax=Riccia sorocarpa TaxID=122646 RepID=A0ABD3HGV9_9MARC